MSIFSLKCGFIQRSQGNSTVGFSAYFNGEKAKDERTGRCYNFSHKKDVIKMDVIAPEGAPAWAKNKATLWNVVEDFEDQIAHQRFRGNPKDPVKNQKSLDAREVFIKTAQTGYTIMGAIPHEFKKEEATRVVQDFLTKRFASRGLLADPAIHWEKGNPHFHAQIPRRALEGESFSQKKDLEIVSKAGLLETRRLWAECVNLEFERQNLPMRIDHRSYADRGIDLIPTMHEGYHARKLMMEGKYSRVGAENEKIRQENMKILTENPEILIREVASSRTVFTEKDLERAIIRHVGGDQNLFNVLKSKVEGLQVPQELVLKTSNQNKLYEGGERAIQEAFARDLERVAKRHAQNLIQREDFVHPVGENLRREKVYTSKAIREEENRIEENASKIEARSSKPLDPEILNQTLKETAAENGFEFSSEQKRAVQHLSGSSDLAILMGRAGTGKTTVLKPLARAYERQGYEVIGCAFQGSVAETMREEIGIPSETLDTYRHAYETIEELEPKLRGFELYGKAFHVAKKRIERAYQYQFKKNQIIFVDEANMVPGRLMDMLLEKAHDVGAKVIFIQDNAQIKSLEGGDTARLLSDKFGCSELKVVRRQKVLWQAKASMRLNDGRIRDGFYRYYAKGCLTWQESREEALRSLADDYVRDMREAPHKVQMALALRNADVFKINEMIRARLKEEGVLTQHFKVGGQEYSLGERFFFGENDKGWHVKDILENSQENPKGFKEFSENPLKYLREELNPIVHKGVKNGQLGTIQSYDGEGKVLYVRLDSKEKETPGRLVAFNVEGYNNFSKGYAITINKSEGSTYDLSKLYMDPLMCPPQALVGATRHKYQMQGYLARDEFLDFKDFVEQISCSDFKSTLLDYKVPDTQKPYLQNVQNYLDLVREVGELNAEMEASPKKGPTYEHPSYQVLQSCYEEKKRLAVTILRGWEEHAPFVRLGGIRRDVLEVEVGIRPRLLSDAEERVEVQVQGYMDLARETRALWQEISKTHPANLSRKHRLYGEYQVLKWERDSIAGTFLDQEKLAKPFFRFKEIENSSVQGVLKQGPKEEVVSKTEAIEGASHLYKDYWGKKFEAEDRVSWKGAEAHGKAWVKEAHLDLFYERLTDSDRRAYDTLKDYKDVRNEVASFWSLKRHMGEEALGKVWKGPQRKIRALQIKRDQAAYQVLSDFEKVEKFLPALGIDARAQETLLDQAIRGEFRADVRRYQYLKDPQAKGIRAISLLDALENSAKPLRRDFQRILKEEGLTPLKLQVDLVYEEKYESGSLQKGVSSEALYKGIIRYLNVAKRSSTCWKEIQSAPKEGYRDLARAQIEDLNAFREKKLSYGGLYEEYKEKSQKVSNQNFENFAYGRLRAVTGRITKKVAGEHYGGMQGRLHEMKGMLSSFEKSPFDVLKESGREKQFKSLNKLRNQQALRLIENPICSEVLKEVRPKAFEKAVRLSESVRSKDLVRSFKGSLSFYGSARLALKISERLKIDQDEGTTKTVRLLKDEEVSFMRLHLYDAVGEGFKSGKRFNEKDREVLQERLEDFVTGREGFSRIWKECGEDVPSRETLERAQASLSVQVTDLLKESFEGEDFQREVKNFATKLERRHRSIAWKYYDGTYFKKIKLEARKSGEKLSGEDLSERTQAYYKEKTHELVEKILGEKNPSDERKKNVEDTLQQIAQSRQDIYEETLEVLRKDEGLKKEIESYAEQRDKNAYYLMKYGFLKDYVKKSSSLHVKGILNFADRGKQRIQEEPLKEEKGLGDRERPQTPIDKDVVLEALERRGYGEIVQDALRGQDMNTRLSNQNQMRYGRKGSFTFNIDGPHKGSWKDWATGDGGNIFNLLEREKGLSFKEAIDYVASYCGIQADASQNINVDPARHERREALEAERIESAMKEREEKLKDVQSLFEKSRSIAGTQAETYLRNVRGTKGTIPGSLRYLEAGTAYTYKGEIKKIYGGAMASFARDGEGNLRAVQLTYLKDGVQVLDREGAKRMKISHGLMMGSFVEIQSGKGSVYVAEGVETALSIKEAGVEGRIVAALGIHNLKNVPVEEGEKVFICADYDGEGSNTEKQTLKIEEELQEKGHDVQILWPAQSGTEKLDFNDVLLKDGPDALRKIIGKETCSENQVQNEMAIYKTYFGEKEGEDLQKRLEAKASFKDLSLQKNLKFVENRDHMAEEIYKERRIAEIQARIFDEEHRGEKGSDKLAEELYFRAGSEMRQNDRKIPELEKSLVQRGYTAEKSTKIAELLIRFEEKYGKTDDQMYMVKICVLVENQGDSFKEIEKNIRSDLKGVSEYAIEDQVIYARKDQWAQGGMKLIESYVAKDRLPDASLRSAIRDEAQIARTTLQKQASQKIESEQNKGRCQDQGLSL